MKIMLFCPTYRIEPETLDSIFCLDVGGHLVHIVFSRGNHWSNNGHANIFMAYREAQMLFLAHDYDAMMIVESDTIVPPDALLKLAALDADVALGLYIHRHGRPWFNAQRFQEDTPQTQGFFYLINEVGELWGNSNLRVSGGGLGCALIKRAVLQDIKFRLEWLASKNKRGVFILSDCDSYFMADVLTKNYTMRMDATIVCGHKKPEGDVLWPTPDGMSIEASTPTPYPIC